MIYLYKHVTIFIVNAFRCVTTCDTIFQALDYTITFHKYFDIHAWLLFTIYATINITDDQILRYIYQTTCQVSRIGCTKGCIRKSLTSTMRRDEVLQYVKTFTEV